MVWHRLPTEIRFEILMFVVDLRAAQFRQEDRYAFAGYASVCQEWQWFFESLNFGRVILDQDRISDFEKFITRVPRRRATVAQIHLHVRLAEYDCSICQVEEDQEARKQNNIIFTRAVVDLLAVLSKWPRRIIKPRFTMQMLGGLSLEISAFSPSDYQHGFRDFRLQDDYPIDFIFDTWGDEDMDWMVERERAEQMKLEQHHDPDHGWENGRQNPVSLGARKRVTEKLTMWDGAVAGGKHAWIPKVRAITTFTVRRQSYRGIDCPSLKRILGAFPNLHYFIHEPWYNVTPERQQLFETEYLRLIRSLPKINTKLRKVLLFQDSSRTLNPEKPTDGRGWSRGARTRRPLGRALAKTTRLSDMDFFSAGFLIDAFDFFHEFHANLPQQPDEVPGWSSLKTLYLTSGRLNPHLASWKRQDVLSRAGRAAAQMPSLESMVLWNGGEGFCYIMRYIRFGIDREPMLVLASNIDDVVQFDFSPQVLAVWRLVPKSAREPSHIDPHITINKIERLPATIRSFAYTVSLLAGQKDLDIVHRVTAHQMIAEHRFFLPLTHGA